MFQSSTNGDCEAQQGDNKKQKKVMPMFSSFLRFFSLAFSNSLVFLDELNHSSLIVSHPLTLALAFSHC